MASEFANRTALVTGAAHGIGRAVAQAFAAGGATVWGSDVAREPLAETGRIVGCRTDIVDVSDTDAVNAWVAAAAKEAGHIDALVHVAGGVRGQVWRPIDEVSDTDWNDILQANLYGAFRCIRAVAPAMKRQGSGRIVIVSSGAGRSFSLTGIQAYTSAKAGELGLTRQMARELGSFGITVNSVAPGFVRSNPSTEKQWLAMGEAGQKALVESISLHRLGKAEEIAAAVAFLCSDAASYVSGQVLSVDGGRSMF
ncbi:MAG TPA: SDR family NAD(P)-dependent oxidoreductase [Bacillota bacterium]|nr:SDR family NAD(P)-dependent oxidoreductase [Bacillota bacterium]